MGCWLGELQCGPDAGSAGAIFVVHQVSTSDKCGAGRFGFVVVSEPHGHGFGGAIGGGGVRVVG